MGHLDTHCHLDDPRFADDRPAVAKRALAAGVTAAIVPGVNADALDDALPEMPGMALYRAVGLHPAFAHAEDALARLEAKLADGTCVAVGECGLDRRYRQPGDVARFHAQLDLARAFDLPVILHVVHAHEEVLAALAARPGLRGVVHAFAGAWPLAQRYLDRGMLLGIGGIATWPTAKRLHETIRAMPADAFVLETDAPDLSPWAVRGQRNEPAELPGIADAVAMLRGGQGAEMLAASDAAAAELFGISPGSGVRAGMKPDG